jgi:hypothetical protein
MLSIKLFMSIQNFIFYYSYRYITDEDLALLIKSTNLEYKEKRFRSENSTPRRG